VKTDNMVSNQWNSLHCSLQANNTVVFRRHDRENNAISRTHSVTQSFSCCVVYPPQNNSLDSQKDVHQQFCAANTREFERGQSVALFGVITVASKEGRSLNK